MDQAFEKYRNILDNLYDGVYFVDTERKIKYWNGAAERITGFTAKEVVETYCWNGILKHINDKGDFLCEDGCPLEKSMKDGSVCEMSVFLHHKSGARVPVYVRSIPVVSDSKVILGSVEIFTDNSEREKILKEIKALEKIAMLDQLTQLPNRRYMENSIDMAINSFLNVDKKFGLIFVDIDNFKSFNDKYGHDIGDKVLINSASTFRHNLENGDSIGRWGGEEFIGIIHAETEEILMQKADKFRILIKRTEVENKGEILGATISMGATLIRKGDTLDSIVKRADELMYKSKINGKDRVTLG